MPARREADRVSRTQLLCSLAALSRALLLPLSFVTPRNDCRHSQTSPTTPDAQRSRAITYVRFRLFPVRSPLLGESLLLSFPGGTEMVHFPPFASRSLFHSGADDQGLPWPGCPIRRSSGRSLLAAHRGLSQLTASFIALVRQGIHRMPLVA